MDHRNRNKLYIFLLHYIIIFATKGIHAIEGAHSAAKRCLERGGKAQVGSLPYFHRW